MISSIHPGEGKTFISINLSRILASSGKKVLLVDFDMHKPKVHKVLEMENKKGNSTFISGTGSLEDFIQKLDDNLYILTSGIVPPNPSELVLSDRVDDIVKYADENFDFLILDTPPIGYVSDGLYLSSKVNSSLFVMNTKKADKKGVKFLEDVVVKSSIASPGIILNGLKNLKA